MQEKTRLDLRIVELGLTSSREKAQVLIQAGLVQVNGQKTTKSAQQILLDDHVVVIGKEHPYVSRGGLKLEKALDVFALSVTDLVCMDIGASTGGFTDCLLQNGAKKVYALDVGYGQLDWRLRSDERVITKERCNARYMEPAWFEEMLDFACMDVSFISIRRMLEPLYECLCDGANIVALIKPQFEAGREKIGKNGVIREEKTHLEVIVDMLWFVRDKGYTVCGLDFSPITGPKGNIEFLLWLAKSKTLLEKWTKEMDGEQAKTIVQQAHEYHTKTSVIE